MQEQEKALLKQLNRLNKKGLRIIYGNKS